MNRVYEIKVKGDSRLKFEADLANAQATIHLVTEDDHFPATPFQTADAKHRPMMAAVLINHWLRNEGEEAWADGEVPTISYA